MYSLRMLQRLFFITIAFFHIASASVTLKSQDESIVNFPIMYFNDVSGDMDIDVIAKTSFDTTIRSQFSLGYPLGDSWFKLTLHSDENNKNEKYILHFTEVFFSKVNFFRYENNGWVEEKSGFDVALKDRKIEDSSPSFFLNIKPGESKTYYIQAFTIFPRFGALEIFTPKEFIKHKEKNIILYMLYFGGMIMIFLFNAFLYLTLKDKLYGYYTMYVFFTTIWVFASSGWHLHTSLAPYSDALQTSAPLLIASLVLFSSTFLNIKSIMPRIYKMLLLFVWILIVLAVLINIDLVYYRYLTAVSTIVFSSLIYVAVVIWRKGSSQAGYYLLAISIFIVSMVFFTAMANGWISNHPLTRYGFLFASAIEIIIFSLMIANRFHLAQNETIKLQRDLIKIQNKDAKELEKLIQERTKNLDENNRLLSYEIKNKNVLLKELYHRVKNNLQVISSLLTLQSRRIKDEVTRSIFDETNQRIKAMAMIHEKLYKSDDLEAVDMRVYVLDLVENLKKSFQTSELTFKIDCDDFKLDLEKAVPMGLIINELVTNSIKYAFDEEDKNKIINIKMYMTEDDGFILEVYDNGKGTNLEAINEGFGFKLIESLASFQLKGKIESFNENGLRHKITFSKTLLI